MVDTFGSQSHFTCSSAPSYTRMDDTVGSKSHLICFSAPNCTVSLISPVFLHQVVHLGSFLCEPLTLQQVTHLHPEITKFSSQGLLKSHVFYQKSMSKSVTLRCKITLVVYLVIMQVTVLCQFTFTFFAPGLAVSNSMLTHPVSTQRVQQLRKCRLEHSVKFLITAVTLTFNTPTQSFHSTPQLRMMYHQCGFGCKRISTVQQI